MRSCQLENILCRDVHPTVEVFDERIHGCG